MRFRKVALIVTQVKMLLKHRDVHVTLSSPAKKELQGWQNSLSGTYRRGGQRYYSETASRKVTALISGGFFDPASLEVMGFDPTELRIIRLMCQDTDSADIATELNISARSLMRYRTAIMEKAGVKTHTGLVFWAVKEGVVR